MTATFGFATIFNKGDEVYLGRPSLFRSAAEQFAAEG